MKSLVLLIPLLSFILLFFSLHHKPGKSSRRELFLSTSVIFGLLIAAITEILSLLNQIAFPGFLLSWLVILIVVAYLFYRSYPKNTSVVTFPEYKMNSVFILVISLVGLYIILIALVGIIAPPNTWDSLEYHMPKVAHWIQNQNIAFYPTHNPRQNHQSPGTEFFILHLQVLSDTDRYANLVSFFCMMGSLLGGSLIAKKMGSGLWGQLLTIVFILTLPMGIMQASSTQTDYTAAFWMICLVNFILNTFNPENNKWRNYLFVSASLGLGVLTKATAYIYAIPFLLWMTYYLIKKLRLRSVKYILYMAVIFLSINSGQYIRNYNLHGNPMGPGTEPEENTKYTNDVFTPKVLISNTIKNVAIHANIPWEHARQNLDSAIVKFHNKLDFPVSDQRTTWGRTRFSVRGISLNDEVGGNPLHIILIFICGGLIFLLKKLRITPYLIYYAISLCVAFLLFSYLLKWNPWHSRLHLPLFVIAGPLCGVVFSKLFHQKTLQILTILLLFLHWPWLLKCEQRPVVGEKNIFNTSRFEMYFNHRPRRNQIDKYKNSWEYIKSGKVNNLGIITNSACWEYVYWAMAYEEEAEIRIENVNVRDISNVKSSKKAFIDFKPDAVLCLVRQSNDTLIVNNLKYYKTWSENDFSIFTREN